MSLLKERGPFATPCRQAELRDRIARRDYELYERRGGKDGDDMADWLKAEAEVKAALKAEEQRPCWLNAIEARRRTRDADLCGLPAPGRGGRRRPDDVAKKDSSRPGKRSRAYRLVGRGRNRV